MEEIGGEIGGRKEAMRGILGIPLQSQAWRPSVIERWKWEGNQVALMKMGSDRLGI